MCWYCRIIKEGVVDDSRSPTQRYANYMESLWELSGERHNWVAKEACILSWFDKQLALAIVTRPGEKPIVHGIHVERIF